MRDMPSARLINQLFPTHSEQHDLIVLRNLLRFRCAVVSVVLIVTGLLHTLYSPVTDLITVLAVLVFALVVTVGQLFNMQGALIANRLVLFASIVFDYFWVFIFVLFLGKSSNPFIYYYLALVAFSASIFNVKAAWAFCFLSIFIYSGLLASDISLHFHHFTTDFQLHLVGMWLNFVGSTLLICFFVNKLSAQLRSRQQALVEARENTLKKEQMVGLGTVAASMMHALATPLSTITVLLEDLIDEGAFDQHKRDYELILQQIQRCKETMSKLSASVNDNQGAIENAVDLFERVNEYCNLHHPAAKLTVSIIESAKSLALTHSVLLDHAIINLVNNAIEATQDKVSILYSVHDTYLIIRITNDVTKNQLDSLENWGQPQDSQKDAGLGIGTFLANSTIEKLGGDVSITVGNADTEVLDDDHEGKWLKTQVEIRLPTKARMP